jgi:hypothetical protein
LDLLYRLAMLRTSAKGEPARCLRENPVMNEFEHFWVSDAGARLEGRALAVVALLLAGIGFWQHYDNYVDAEESRVSIFDEQTALQPADDSTAAAMPDTSETFEHAQMHVQLSDKSWRDCRYR